MIEGDHREQVESRSCNVGVMIRDNEIFAVFSVPTASDDDAADNALRCADLMLASLDRWNTEHEGGAERAQYVEGSGTLPQDGKEYAIQAGDVMASLSARRHQIIDTSKMI